LTKGVVLKYMLNKFTVLEVRDSFVVDVSALSHSSIVFSYESLSKF